MTTTEYLIQLSESPCSGFAHIDFTEQNYEQKVFSSVFGSSGSIFMDGLALFLHNTDSQLIQFSPDAYKLIHAPTSAEIIELSFRACGFPPSFTEEQKTSHLSDLNKKQVDSLNQLDQAFYSTGEILDDLLFDFVASHSDVFGLPSSEITRRA